MSNEKLEIVPKLRFPEFSGEWEEKKLDDIFFGKKGQGLSKSDIDKNGQNKCILYGELYTKYSETIDNVISRTNLNIGVKSKAGDLLVPCSTTTTNIDLANVTAINENNVLLGDDISILRFKKNGNSVFFAYYLTHPKKFDLTKYGQGSTIVHLYYNHFKKMSLCVPAFVKEQKKIADCLSSLDELITLQTQKINHLKTQKKGLMQQLFPAEEKTTPKLRFPEFVNDGDWEEKYLEKICQKISQGGTPDTLNPNYWNGNIEWLTPAEMGKLTTRFIISTNRKITEIGLQKCSSSLLPINSVILSTRAPIGHLVINKSEMAINQGCKGLIPKKTTNHNYLYYSLLNQKSLLNDLGSGNTFKELSASTLKKIKIKLPKLPEQQKIADCLTSLDKLITLQTQKIESLKTHKKGLMQQLFPNTDEDSI